VARAQAPSEQAGRADSDWVLQKLARPAPMRTDFVEVRDSPLLKAPLRLSGEYRRPDAATLVREVRTPYAETTTIRAGQATIARAGKPPRTFSLSRAPELAGLQASFGAMLSGDRATLEKFYRVSTEGTRQQWSMTLVPKDAQLAGKVRDITLHGRGAELRCIETRPVADGRKKGQGDIQRTLLAGAARAAGPSTTAEELIALCHAGSAG
jgi:hypothetical protein